MVEKVQPDPSTFLFRSFSRSRKVDGEGSRSGMGPATVGSEERRWGLPGRTHPREPVGRGKQRPYPPISV